ncbi:MAG: hypothetical protein HJJLKODD_02815 [Phycisphaerae bacterium]|nr:hypothetical protein [Phycisphaerae bacterium]
MTPNQLMAEMRDYADLLLNQGVALTANPVVPQHPEPSLTRITSQRPATRSSRLTDFAFASIDEYRALLESQDYLVVLADGAVIQLSYDFRGLTLVRHRLCFYPCPYDIDPAFLEEDPMLDVVDMYHTDGSGHLRLRTPLRFDFDGQHEDEDHSATHVHMLWAHCRCAVSGPVSIGRFSRFVFRHFYPHLWREHKFLRELKQERWDRSIRMQDEEFLHFSWREPSPSRRGASKQLQEDQ